MVVERWLVRVIGALAVRVLLRLAAPVAVRLYVAGWSWP